MSTMQMLFSFNGRIRRMHWWLVRLGVFFAAIALMFVVVGGIGAAFGSVDSVPETVEPVGGTAVLVIYLAVLWIELALDVKRWHDRDKSGWWIFIALIPIIGPIWSFIELGFLDGTQGPNDFGPSPKGIGGSDLARVFS
jgi:uncharacterized membrane protein YhaH (DUF805 family)